MRSADRLFTRKHLFDNIAQHTITILRRIVRQFDERGGFSIVAGNINGAGCGVTVRRLLAGDGEIDYLMAGGVDSLRGRGRGEGSKGRATWRPRCKIGRRRNAVLPHS